MTEKNEQPNKSDRALSEEAVLAFWKEKNIFEKTLEKEAPKGDFVFYEGPPTANAKPALHHLEARAFKDVIPRYKTMRGYHVPRRAGWDTHGLPVELQIEKKLGFNSKKDIESYGVAKFNKECKESVFTYIKDWEDFTDRMGYWVDKSDAYYTFNNSYIEALWGIVGKINDRGLLYKDYRVTPWCTRCGTTLASHELAQGYLDVKDLSIYTKFKVLGQENTYLLAWTTTPWTLPGNVALAVGKDIDYQKYKINKGEFSGQTLIYAKERHSALAPLIIPNAEITENDLGTGTITYIKGSDLVGLEYEPLFDDLKTHMQSSKLQKEIFSDWVNGWKVYEANFVNTTDGTGIVHVAPMYGIDDFELATKHKLPKLHTVDETGHFITANEYLEGRYVKEVDDNGKPTVAVDIINDLKKRNLFFSQENVKHPYPHCWRCKTPLIYYARDSWYVRMSQLRQELLESNETINWEPEHIKEGRFGEWLREVKDWAFSRERYWGTPLPVWRNDDEQIVVDSLEKLKSLSKSSGNKYFVMRHGQTHHNLEGIWSCDSHLEDPLTPEGKLQVQKTAEAIKGKNIDMIICSPFPRTQQSAHEVAMVLGFDKEAIIADKRLGEWNIGKEYDQRPYDEFFAIRNSAPDRYGFKIGDDSESYADVITRAGDFIYDIEQKYQGKNILIITHGGVTRSLELIAKGFSYNTLHSDTRDYPNFNNAEVREVPFVPIPHNEKYELDLHKPYIDEVVLEKDGKELKRVKEVIDVWFDSGSMPFASDNKYPADFISEAIDQTRGWFYTMLAVGVLMEKGSPYKNVICLGHLLDKDGKKMSKSVGNIVEPYEQMDKFGADAVRYWMYSVNAPGESKNYDEKSIAEVNNKVFNLLGNVLSFYELYRDTDIENTTSESKHVLDQWIVARLNQLIAEVTTSLDGYDLFKPTRAIQDFIGDLSTWYLRRSRDRIKDGDVDAKRTLYHVLKTTAQLIAPFAPFFAESIWQKLKNATDPESVHLSLWPVYTEINHSQADSITYMEDVRYICTLGNAERKINNIPVKQPLEWIYINDADLVVRENSYFELIKDELNVKKVIFGDSMDKSTASMIKKISIDKSKKVQLNTEISKELKQEGNYRELIRIVQDLRKESNLNVFDPAKILLFTETEEGKKFILDSSDKLKKNMPFSELIFQENDGNQVKIDEMIVRIKIEK